MKKYLYDYIKEVDNLLNSNKITKDIIERHLVKISFFQHERLIHLLVTLAFALVFITFVILGFSYPTIFYAAIIVLILLIFYVVHYYHLENGVQYLYKQYDKMIKRV